MRFAEKHLQTFFRRLKNWRIHYYHFSLQTFIRLRVIYECFVSKENEKKKFGQRLIGIKRMQFMLYDYTKEYSAEDISVLWDEDGYPYVYHGCNKLYLKKEWNKEYCQKYYTSLLIEQDEGSPHKYLASKNRCPGKEDVVADIGAAEGNFSLDIVDGVKKIYIFEGDDEWEIPLKKTFSKWQDKIELVKKYVGNCDNENYVTLDNFFSSREISYIKADIEGAEALMLHGGASVLRTKIKKAVICTYHRPHDEEVLKKIMTEYGFKCEYSRGYVLYIWDMELFKPPYVRRCLMYCDR